MKNLFSLIAVAALVSCVPVRAQPAPVLADPVTGVLVRPSAALFKSANSIGTGEGGGIEYTFTATDFNLSGVTVSLDFTNAQKASSTLPGFLTAADWITFHAKAGTNSPTFTGTPIAPTAAADTNTTQIATTAFVVGQLYLKAATAASTYQPLDAFLTGTTASFTSALKTKLDGIATGATANDTDTNLRDRASHTGAQAVSTVTGLQTALDALQPLDADLTTYAGITPSANVQSILGGANYAAIRTLLDLEAGTDFLAYPTGTPTGAKYLRDDNTWQAITGGDVTLTGTNVYTAGSSTFNAGTTATFNGTLSGTPTGGTLDLSGVTLTLGNTTVSTLNVTAFGTGTLLGANGGTGVANTHTITTTANATIGGTHSGTNTGDQSLFQNIVISGQTTVTANSTTGNLTFVAGDGVTLATNNTTKTITINSTGGSGTAVPGLWPTADIASPPSGFFAAGEYGTTANTALGAWSIIVPSLGTVANPTVDIAAGAVPAGTVITFSSATGTPFFTSTNNTTDPTYTVGDVGATRTISGNQTVEVRANKLGNVSSGVESFAYTIDALPTLTSATVPTGGTDITLLFSEAVRIGAGGSGGWVPTLSGGAATFTYASGNTTTSLVYTSNRTINSGETGTLAYTQPGNGIEENAGYFQDVATIASATITNNSTAGGGVTYLIEENMEETGLPSSGAWTVSAGSINWDYTTSPAPFQGSQSAYSSSSGSATYATFTGQTTVEAYAQVATTTLPASNSTLFAIRDSGGNALCMARVTSTGAIDVFTAGADSGSPTVSTITGGTKVHIWLRFVSGGTSTVAWSTDGTRPTSGNNFTSKGSSSSGTAARLQFSGTAYPVMWDRVLVLNGVIGSNP